MFPFVKLKVYQKAFYFHKRVYGLLKKSPNLSPYLRNQFGRASLSILLNIAEGSAKFSPKDRRNFYIIARGSVFECASLIQILKDEGELEVTLEYDLTELLKEISAMLFTMINNLGSLTKKS